MRQHPTQYYHYAMNDGGKLIVIEDATRDKHYTCPYCKHDMSVVQGKIRRWHFRHKRNYEDCDYNKYLHTLAEIKIEEWFNRSESIRLYAPHIAKCESVEDCSIHKLGAQHCSREQNNKSYDIKGWYTKCEREGRWTQEGCTFVADLLLTGERVQHSPLFIEIYVTHKCEPKKIDSGIRIIELYIQCEEDIERICRSTSIKESKDVDLYDEPKHKFITLYNFKKSEYKYPATNFSAELYKFIMFKTEKTFVEDRHSCHDFRNHRKSSVFEISFLQTAFIFISDIQRICVAYAMSLGLTKRNCQMCKFKGYSEYESVDICCLYKKHGTQRYCRDNNARECSHFWRNEDVYHQSLSEFEELRKDIVEIWKAD